MASGHVSAVPALPSRPRLRGVLHQYTFVLSVLVGAALVSAGPTARARVVAAVFAASVAAMLGASAVYHRVTWRPRARRWMARVDHTALYLLIAGTYTPYGILVLSGAWRTVVLAVVWSGVAVAIGLKWAWLDAPKWLAAATGLAFGWAGAFACLQIARELGATATALLLVGGILYTAGAIVYTRRRPDPAPAVFGYHELFHALVVGAVACHYASIAFFVVPRG